jgi:hypothetical protein
VAGRRKRIKEIDSLSSPSPASSSCCPCRVNLPLSYVIRSERRESRSDVDPIVEQELGQGCLLYTFIYICIYIYIYIRITPNAYPDSGASSDGWKTKVERGRVRVGRRGWEGKASLTGRRGIRAQSRSEAENERAARRAITHS